MQSTKNKTYFCNVIKAAILVTPMLVFSPAVFASDDDKSKSDDVELIITGSRVPKSVDKIPGAVNIITEEDIKDSLTLSADVTSMLTRSVPGYSESRQQLSNSGETLRGRIALRLFDGVPQGSPLREGNRNALFTDMGIIGRVEVINGPSAKEGIGGAGGIINYISKTATELGTKAIVSAQYRTQFEDDSEGWRLGLNVEHKNEDYDVLIAMSQATAGIGYDGNGRRIGIGTSGSASDSQSNNLFLKLGKDFGTEKQQRIELSISSFLIGCQCNYFLERGDRDAGITNTAVKGQPPGAKASFNDFSQKIISYTNDDFLGGALFMQYYTASQAMRYEAEYERGKQEPAVVPFTLDDDGFPIGEWPLLEQSEINSQKEGFRFAWDKIDLLDVDGLDVQIGVDLVEDVAQQLLTMVPRPWVPPMEYTSTAPFAQFSYDMENVTLTAGIRIENGELYVADYTSVWDKDRRFVEGGTLDYKETLLNFGAIWRITDGLSVFASYSDGFTLPNAGIPLRNISCDNDTSPRGDPNDPINQPFGGIQPDGCPNDPQLSVGDIIDLEAVLVESTEIGMSWKGDNANFSASYYTSDSEFGTTLRTDPVFGDYILVRRPIEIEGYEFSGGYTLSDTVDLTAMYSHTEGVTRKTNEGPLDRELGIRDVGPDKFVMTANWEFSDAGSVMLASRTVMDNDINEDASGEEHISGYTLFDLTANYQIGNGTLSVGIDNVADKFYILSSGQVGSWRGYFAGRGRTMTIGYTIEL